MRVLLVNPYIYDFTAYDLWLRPLGLLYIAGVLEKYTEAELYWLDTLDRFQAGAFLPGDPALKGAHADGSGKFHREVVEKNQLYTSMPRTYARYGMPLESFREKIDNLPGIDIILVTSLMTYWVDGVRITIDTLRERFPRARIVLGGILPSLVSPEDLRRHHIFADHYIAGYGETQILPLMKTLGVPVLPHPDLDEINRLPYPAIRFLGTRRYVPLITSRGCPYHCTYCASDLLNKKFVERDAGSIYREIEFMHHTYGAKHFAIFDDAFLINKHRRFFKVFEKVRDTLDVSFHTPNGLHAKEMDRETAEIFYKSGFETIRLSFESTRAEILGRSSGKVTVRQMVEAVENLEKAGYKRKNIGAYLLFGLPGQKPGDLEASLDFAEELGILPNLSYYSPVPGTVDFLAMQKAGLLSSPVNLYETNKIFFVYRKSGLTQAGIQAVKTRTSEIMRRSRT